LPFVQNMLIAAGQTAGTSSDYTEIAASALNVLASVAGAAATPGAANASAASARSFRQQVAESVLLLSRTALSDAVAGETRRFSTLTQLSSGAAPVPLALNASRATVAALAASGAAVSGSFSAASSVAYSSFTVPAANQRDLLAAAGASPADALVTMVDATETSSFNYYAPNASSGVLGSTLASLTYSLPQPVSSPVVPQELSLSSLTAPITVRLAHRTLGRGERRSCVFWNSTLRAFSQAGCSLSAALSTATVTVCLCNHLTSFSVNTEIVPGVDLAITDFSSDDFTTLTWGNVVKRPAGIITLGCIYFLYFLILALGAYMDKLKQRDDELKKFKDELLIRSDSIKVARPKPLTACEAISLKLRQSHLLYSIFKREPGDPYNSVQRTTAYFTGALAALTLTLLFYGNAGLTWSKGAAVLIASGITTLLNFSVNTLFQRAGRLSLREWYELDAIQKLEKRLNNARRASLASPGSGSPQSGPAGDADDDETAAALDDETDDDDDGSCKSWVRLAAYFLCLGISGGCSVVILAFSLRVYRFPELDPLFWIWAGMLSLVTDSTFNTPATLAVKALVELLVRRFCHAGKSSEGLWNDLQTFISLEMVSVKAGKEAVAEAEAGVPQETVSVMVCEGGEAGPHEGTFLQNPAFLQNPIVGLAGLDATDEEVVLHTHGGGEAAPDTGAPPVARTVSPPVLDTEEVVVAYAGVAPLSLATAGKFVWNADYSHAAGTPRKAGQESENAVVDFEAPRQSLILSPQNLISLARGVHKRQDSERHPMWGTGASSATPAPQKADHQ
jgi:hypothetical protein